MLARFDGLDDVTFVSEEVGIGSATAAHVVSRPDRRLAQREARHRLLLAVRRRRRRADDGRRRLRLRPRLRHGRGVDGDARRGRVPERRAARRRRGRGPIEILAFEATRTASSRRRRRRWSTSPTACGSWARSRCRSATSRRAAWTPLLAQAGAFGRHRRRRSCSSGSAGSRSTCSRIRPSTRHRSTSWGAHGSPQRGTPELCQQLAAALSA